MNLDLSWWGWAAAIAGAVLVGVSKTGIPGIGILAVALFTAVFPARESAGIVLPLLICADIVAVAAYLRDARWGHLVRLFPWAITGIVVGYFAVGVISSAATARLIGAILVSLAAYQVWKSLRARQGAGTVPEPESPGRSTGFAASMGLLAGFTTMVANAAGPIMNLYLLAMRFPKKQFLGTAAWYFFLLNSFKVPFSYRLGLITWETVVLNLKLAPAVLAGAFAGRLIIHYINQKVFERLALGLALAAGVRLLI